MYPFLYRVYLSRLIININTLKKYFFVWDDRHSFEYASNTHSFNNLSTYRRTHILIVRDYSSLTSLLQILEIFPGNRQPSPRGPGPSYQLRSDVLYKNNKKLFSICPPPLPPGQDRFKQFPTLGPEGLDLSPGLPGGMVTGKIEPCIMKNSY